ncbi:hypothetical protein Celaphus_00014507 [Cervus elaphus hippelaphus]|uniref:Ubiquitin D n=1 Tax=Cervus elaphus hippelaphus TaxID=46360 RepID=A0A212D4D8_CEREH|nr:hypothetical protein Celaphus_00014507 [Cervus elaphus hippelaphus]
MGNSALVLLAVREPRLHTPMYYFLCHLALVDTGFTTSVVPSLLANLRGRALRLERGGCLAQLCASLALGSAECVLLAVMALDRAAAVCRPLRYAGLASPRLCHALAGAAWLGGLTNSAAQTALLAARPLCAPRRVDHFICELPALLQLACDGGGQDSTERQMFAARVFILLVPSAVILASYGGVARAVWGMRTRGSRRKAVGTCGSHLTAVCLFYGSAIYTYLQPAHNYNQRRGKFISLFYTVVTPALNPLLTTLRNKEVKGAARRLLGDMAATAIDVTVHSEQWRPMTFTAHPGDRVNKINEHVRSRTKVPVQEQVLQLGSKTLKSQRTLSSYGIDKETTIHLTLKVVKPSDEKLPLVLVEPGYEGQRHELQVRRSSSVTQVKEMIKMKTAIPPKKQIVNCNGKKLEDGKIMGDYGIKKGHLLFLTYHCIGGKIQNRREHFVEEDFECGPRVLQSAKESRVSASRNRV